MSIFDHNKDGVLHVAELNATFSALEQQASKDLDILRSQGRYFFNASVPSPASYLLANFSSEAEVHAGEYTELGKLGSIDSNGDEYVTAEEFSRSGYTILRRIMKVYDGNRDGIVCFKFASFACLPESLHTHFHHLSLCFSVCLSVSVCPYTFPHRARARALSLSLSLSPPPPSPSVHNRRAGAQRGGAGSQRHSAE